MVNGAESPAILVVADSTVARALELECSASPRTAIRVHTAVHGSEAFEVLRVQPIQLVVADLQTPGLGGFELLAQMVRDFPHLPVLVLTSFAASSPEAQVASAPTIAYVEKPIDARRLRERIALHLAPSTTGHLRGVSVPSFLQLLEAERTTCTLELLFSDRVGRLAFDAGVLIDAVLDDLEGDEAVFAILDQAEAPELRLDARPLASQRRISTSLTHLLLEAARRRDEAGRLDDDEAPDLEGWGLGNEAHPVVVPRFDAADRAKMAAALERLCGLDGVLATAVFELGTGALVETAGPESGLNVAAAVRRQASVLRAAIAAGDRPSPLPVEELLLTHAHGMHLLRPIAASGALVLYLVLDREFANLALARLTLREVERSLGAAMP